MSLLDRLAGRTTSHAQDSAGGGQGIHEAKEGASKYSGNLRWYLPCFLGLASLGALFILWHSGLANAGTPLLVALAGVAAGGMIGFLFGIPKVLQGDPPAKPPPPPPPPPGKQPAPTGPRAAADKAGPGAAPDDTYRQQVNTSLEQISDWLTKILVGVGLVQLYQLPAALASASSYLAQGMGAGGDNTVFMGAVIVYFPIVGFFAGYLGTRLFLGPVFGRTDRAWADQLVELGRRITSVAETADQQQQRLVQGMIQGIGKLPLPVAAATAEAASRRELASADPNKGQFGGSPRRDGRILSARFLPWQETDELFSVQLQVASEDPAGRPLTGPVEFHLHPTFANPVRTVEAVNNVAALGPLVCWGAFTVGAKADGGQTDLELDLATLPDAPPKFRAR